MKLLSCLLLSFLLSPFPHGRADDACYGQVKKQMDPEATFLRSVSTFMQPNTEIPSPFGGEKVFNSYPFPINVYYVTKKFNQNPWIIAVKVIPTDCKVWSTQILKH
jgi:hypothetical protein